MAMLRKFLGAIVDIVYPKVCAACKKHLKDTEAIDNLVCAECWAKIKINPPPFPQSLMRFLQYSYTS